MMSAEERELRDLRERVQFYEEGHKQWVNTNVQLLRLHEDHSRTQQLSAMQHLRLGMERLVADCQTALAEPFTKRKPRHSGVEAARHTTSQYDSSIGRGMVIPTTLPEMIYAEDWEKWQTKAGVLFPSGTFKFRWDLVIVIVILYSSVTVPFRLCMGKEAEGAWWWLEMTISLVFIVDLALNFRTAYLDGDHLVIKHSRIGAHYLRTWSKPSPSPCTLSTRTSG